MWLKVVTSEKNIFRCSIGVNCRTRLLRSTLDHVLFGRVFETKMKYKTKTGNWWRVYNDISQRTNYDRGSGSNVFGCCSCCTTKMSATEAIHLYDLSLMIGMCTPCGDRTVKLAVTH